MSGLCISVNEEFGFVECAEGRLEFLVADEMATICAIEVVRKRRGVGTALIQHFDNYCRAKGLSDVFVPATPSKRVVSFWIKNGFSCFFPEDTKIVKRILNKVNSVHITNVDSGIIALRKELV